MYQDIKSLELPAPPFLKKWSKIYIVVVLYLSTVIASLSFLSASF